MDNLEVLGRLPDYLLIRLITVFDPDFFRVFFLVRSFGFPLLQANEVGVLHIRVCSDGADHSKTTLIRVMFSG
ncbi:hypothetical protein ALQ08_102963 [Pseudomonas syringae pv. delphinii]|uniref:Uncharacterized protein n=2 Tax=Pseudomonas syringae group TaxID=136849 RepID=A0A0N8RCL2_9PSED|nr:hypothetical protein ALO72_102379 [Pseudomonas syringae pv. delphinii]RMP13171.1 hypothetical protein ALQ28_102833 [Pseudomonas syringae pv. delphinii]RMP26271.1 hypothetical protein ALQ27_103023 [Pseudomonas syringae pv. delphinii]RMQ27141.1 hypothetical protein ALQ08_102963 [Pseudomonas syringae pv. delphinii]